MVDAHCHLNFHAFKNDIDKVIKDAEDKGVKVIVNVGSDVVTSKKAVELAKKYDNLYATVGIHPHHADKLEENWQEELEKLAKQKKVIAIGECGLDYHPYNSNGITDKNIQKKLFLDQIELSHHLKLPLMIHNREAFLDIIDILKNNRSMLQEKPGMFHCFSGDIDFLKEVLNLNFYVGFDGNITYKNSDLVELVKYAPLDRILVETDSPYLAPLPLRGFRNEPQNVIIVAKFIALLKNLDYNSFDRVINNNFKELFGGKIDNV